MSNGYRYAGNGETYRGLPPRDLTQEEYDDLPLLEQRAVSESGAYEEIPAGKKKSRSATAPDGNEDAPAEEGADTSEQAPDGNEEGGN